MKKGLVSHKGVTLVELLISTAVVMVVLSMAINIYLDAKEQYIQLEKRADVDLKQLTTKRLLQDFVGRVGFASKFGSSEQEYIDRTGDSLEGFFLPTNSSLRVGELPLPSSDHIAAALETGCTNECFEDGTDYIMIRGEESHTELIANNSSEVSLELKSNEGLAVDDYLLLSNKDTANLVKINAINDDGVITLNSNPQDTVYYAGDYAGRYSFQVMYVRNTGEQDSDGNDITSLYIYIKSSSAQGRSYELVRGVNNMQVEHATVSGDVITWNAITTDMDINSNDTPAIRVSFDIDDQSFNRIIVL